MASALLVAGAISFMGAQPQSVCGVDDRMSSEAPAVGVVSSPSDGHRSFCTITLIDDRCALTAGHCLNVLGEARFFKNLNHQEDLSGDEFIYAVDTNWTRALQSGIGNDWAVVRLKANIKTGLLPGKVHGFIEPASSPRPLQESELVLDAIQRDSTQTFSSYKAYGQTLWNAKSILYHDLDTVPGGSGALIIDANTSQAIAIHTHGGCETMKNNKATIIAEVPFLLRAIKECRDHQSR